MKQINNSCENLLSQLLGIKNSRFKNLNQDTFDDLSRIYKQINQCQTDDNTINKLRGGGNLLEKPQKQEEVVQYNLNDIINEQDIFQYLKYHTTLLQRILENQKERDQLTKVIQWLNSKGNIYNLSNQGKLDSRQIQIIETAIDTLLSCAIKAPILLYHNLIQFTQNLFQILYSQVKNYNIINNLDIFSGNVQLINQKYQQQKGLEILFNYQFCLIRDVVEYKQDGKPQIVQKFIFEQNKYQDQNELIFILIQEARIFLQDDNASQYDIYYFFQQLKLTTIRILLNQQLNIEIKNIVNQLHKGYQLCIQNNQNWRVHLGFLQMLLELISCENSFIEDLQHHQVNDIINIKFNNLSTQLMCLQIQDNINIWEHYIQTKCHITIKCYLAFSFTVLRNSQNTQHVKSYCQDFIDLFQNSEQDENTLSILKNQKLKVIQEAFEPTQKNQNFNSYKQLLKFHKQKLQEDFILNDQGLTQINIPLKVSIRINDNRQNLQQQSDKLIYLFKEITYSSLEQEQIYVVNDFLWTDNNNTQVLLIQGMAGSGKSNFLRQLQLFLLKHYDSHSIEKKWIPFFVSLAILKEPKNTIWSQILKTDELLFNNEHIKNLSDDIENGQVNIVLLFDGLDEMRDQIQEINLSQINNVLKQKLGKNVKIIITQRKETLIDTSFIGESYKYLTEVEIQQLDQQQIEEYLKQYCREVIRQNLYNFYKIYLDKEYNSRIQFNEYWVAFFLEEITTFLEKTSNTQQKCIITDQFIIIILNKSQKIFDFKNLPPDYYFQISNDFKKMKSITELMRIINNNQIINLLQTPLAHQIVLQILQDIDQLIVNKKNRKDRFTSVLLKLKNQQLNLINQPEQAKLFNIQEYIENLKIKLEQNKFFDEFLLEKLDNQIMQLPEDDLDLIKQATKQTEFTQYQFYKLFIAQYHIKQIKKLKESLNFTISAKFSRDLNKFQMSLAVHMIKQNSFNLNIQEINNILNTCVNQNNFDNTIGFLLIKSALITKLQNGNYQFMNQSILEFFVGKYILRLIKDFSRNFIGKSIEENLEKSQFNQNEFNLSFDQFNQVINNIKQELKNFTDIKTILIKIIILSRDQRFIRAASNSILLINFLKMELIGEDLSRIKLSKTNLSGLNFFGSNLDESVFNEVAIEYCNFNNTSLQGVKWTQTPWSDVSIFNNQNQESVLEMVFSPDSQFLISWGEYSVYIWNLQTKRIHKIINYNLKLKSCIFSSDSTKFLLDFTEFQQVYLIKNRDIKLLIFIPLSLFVKQKNPFTFYNKEDKLVYRINQHWYSYNLTNLIKSQTEWIKQKILDNSTKFTSVRQMSKGYVLIGTQDGQINMWDNRYMNTILTNVHQSAIVSLSERKFEKISDQSDFQNDEFSLLISVSEEQAIVWIGSNYKYKKVQALPSYKVNGQLPRYLNFNPKNLILIRNEYIIFYDLQKINELKEDIIFKDSHCIALLDYQGLQDNQLFIAKNNCIEVYDNLQKCKGKIPLRNCQPLAMHFCSDHYMISYNKDETIRFWFIAEENVDEEYMMEMMQMNPYQNFDPFNQSHLIQGSIKGYVQNLKSSCYWNLREETLKIAVQQNKKQINIYKVQLSKNNIKFDLIQEEKCLEDQIIGCSALFSYGNQICLGIDNIIQIKDLNNNQKTILKEIHKQQIYQIMFNQNEILLVSCSYDNFIVIWNVQEQKDIYCIKNQKCLDLIFESNNKLILQTQKSIIWYCIQDNFQVKVDRYIDFEESGINNHFIQQMSIVKILEKPIIKNPIQDMQQDTYQNQQQYLAIKYGNNIILKQCLNGDQSKIEIFHEQDGKIEFINENFIVYIKESSNILQIADLNDMKVILQLEFCAFAIRERYESEKNSYLIIAVETINDIKVVKIQKGNPIRTVNIEKKDQGNQTRLTLSYNGNFLALINKQQLTIYQITKGLKIIQTSTFFIDVEITDIQISEWYEIIIQSNDFLYYYELNVQSEEIYTEQSNNIVEYQFLVQGLKNYDDTRLNQNDNFLAIKNQNYIDFISLGRQQIQLKKQSWFFSVSIDCKNFVINNNHLIKYYDWQEEIKLLYKFDYEYQLLSISFLQDPNEILAISSNNIQIIQCKENQFKKIKGRYHSTTRASSTQQIAKIEDSIISISKPEININLYHPEEYGYIAKNPQFSKDGLYIIYQQNNEVMFQNLSNPHFQYIPACLQGQMHLSVFPDTNYLITFNKNECLIKTESSQSQKYEYYLNVWDISVLSNLKKCFSIPILQKQSEKMFYQQSFISEINGNILCIYDIKEIQKDIYDKNLKYDIKNVQYAGICPKETNFFIVSKDKSISIWNMKSQQLLKQFEGNKREIIFICFSEDETYMISRDRIQIIVWKIETQEKLIIQEHFLFYNSYVSKKPHKHNKCDFVKLNNSWGITCQAQGVLFIFDLKDFKSYEQYYSIAVKPFQTESFRYQVFSNGTKVGLYLKEDSLVQDKILILDVNKKQVIEAVNINKDEIFFGSPNSDNYQKIKIDKKYDDFGVNQINSYIYVYSKAQSLLQIYNVSDFTKDNAQPIYEVFIHLNEDQWNSLDTLIQLNYVGKHYITYFYNIQLRVIDLKLYQKQIKIIKLDESESFLQYCSKDQILYQKKYDGWYIYNLKDGSKKELFNYYINEIVVAFSNDGQQLAEGRQDGVIIIRKTIDYKEFIKWTCNYAIKHILYTKDDKILISCSQDNIISFWKIQERGILIQQIQIGFNIISIVTSPNKFDIALELQGGLIQIVTIDKSNCYSKNQNYKYIGCYKSYPQLQQLMSQNCIIDNAVIKDLNNRSLLHHFGQLQLIKQEFETVTIQDENQN